jgi:hypothetical protein
MHGLGAREFLQVFAAMTQFAWQYTIAHGADTSVIAVNPRHRNYYTRSHGYLPLGPRRDYDRVQGHPAEGYYLDAELMRARVPDIHRRIFGRTLAAEAFVPARMPEHLIYYFAARSSQTRVGSVEQVLWNVAACGSPRRW